MVAVVALQVLQALSLPPWLFATVFAVSALGEPLPESGTFVVVSALLSYPIWLAGLAVTSWVLVRRDSLGWAVTVAVLASTPMIALLVATFASM